MERMEDCEMVMKRKVVLVNISFWMLMHNQHSLNLD